MNRYFGTELCVSQAIRDANPDTPMRPVGNVLLKGKEQPLRLYEPCETQPDALYEAAHKLLSEDEGDALEAFERLDIQRQDDALVRYQLERLRSGQHGELIVMTDK